MDEGLLTVREAAARCHRNPETIRRWIWNGKLTARKLGNQLFVREGDLHPILTASRAAEIEAQLKLLQEIDESRERIRQRLGGTVNVLELLDEGRASRP